MVVVVVVEGFVAWWWWWWVCLSHTSTSQDSRMAAFMLLLHRALSQGRSLGEKGEAVLLLLRRCFRGEESQ